MKHTLEEYEKIDFYPKGMDDYYTELRTGMVKIRRDRECSNCHNRIVTGNYMWNRRVVFPNEGFGTLYVCTDCLDKYLDGIL